MVLLGVVNEPEADHQFVSSAKYLAALHRMSRSSLSRLTSHSSWRIRSASVTEVDEGESVVVILVRIPVPYLFNQLCRVARLIPRSVAMVWIDAPGCQAPGFLESS